jgi:hypothetical protein
MWHSGCKAILTVLFFLTPPSPRVIYAALLPLRAVSRTTEKAMTRGSLHRTCSHRLN